MAHERSALLLAGLLAVTAAPGAAEDPAGHWRGVMVQHGARLDFTLDIVVSATGLSGAWSAPSMRALAVPVTDLRASGTAVHFALVGDRGATTFDGDLRGDSLQGRFTGAEGEGTFILARAPAPPAGYREEAVQFTNGAVRLAGSLLLPLAPGAAPAVVFVHGSGAEGRHASRFLGEHLARHGVAALVFDKRGVGGSSGDWRTATLDDLAADALAGVALLTRRPDVDGGRVGIYGHSQGGLVAPLAAARSGTVAFVVAGATYGGPAYQQDLFRVERALEATAFSVADREAAMVLYRRFVEVARTGRGHDALERAADSVRGRDWYAWLGIPPRDHWLWRFYPPIGNFDPLPHWSRVRVPVLLLYGADDRVVPADESLRRIGRALDAAGNRRWGAAVLPGAGHDFAVVPRPGEPFAWRRVAPGLPDLVLGWVLAQALGP